ncbi:MAG: molybdenum metabolism regulator [Phototrophicales bacterium]|nr:MAG: molybdenum metabolism regulator [Phototrophicales bacterium]
MNTEQFWQLIESVHNTDTCLDKCDLLVEKLQAYSVEDILSFQHQLDQAMVKSYTSLLWAAAYLLTEGCSDDCFDYFRAWLILNGRAFYERAVQSPDELSQLLTDEMLDNLECEELLGVAFSAYQEKTDKDDFYDVYYAIYEPQTLPNIQLDWYEDDEEALAELLPQLYQWLEGN